MTQKVVIIGHGYSSRLGLMRSLSTIGADISIIPLENDRLKPVDWYSKYVNHIYPCPGRNEEELMHIIQDKCLDPRLKVVLLPTDDFSASFLDKNLNRLNDHFLFPHIHHQQGAIKEWMNKEKQKDLAKSCGLNIANAKTVEINNGQYHLPSGITYPCFTKTRAYVSGCKGTLHKCANEEELRRVFDRLSRKYQQLTVMVEDFKKIDTEYAVVGFSDGKEVVIPGIIEILVMAKGGHRGVACQGKVMPTTGFEHLIEKFKKMILEIGFVGLFDIDFYKSDGIFFFGEINLRIGGSGTAITKSGVHLPVMFVLALSGKPYDYLEKEIKTTNIYINERICTETWQNGHMNTKDFQRIKKTSSMSFVNDSQDKKPGKIYKRYLIIKRIKRFFKKSKQ